MHQYPQHIFYVATYRESLYSGNYSNVVFIDNCQQLLEILSQELNYLQGILSENLEGAENEEENIEENYLNTNFNDSYKEKPVNEIIEQLLEDLSFYAELRIGNGEILIANVYAGIAKPGENINLYS